MDYLIVSVEVTELWCMGLDLGAISVCVVVPLMQSQLFCWLLGLASEIRSENWNQWKDGDDDQTLSRINLVMIDVRW
jgi:hypothetical protein